MKIVEKNMDRREWYPEYNRQFQCKYIKDEEFEGGIGKILFKNMEEPDILHTSKGDKILADNGYTWLELVPKDGNWVVTVMYRENGELFQLYFDITQKNVIFENGDACFYDMFLDVAVDEKGKAEILDEDELEEALETGIINKEEFQMAKMVADEIVDFYYKNRVVLEKKLLEYKESFEM